MNHSCVPNALPRSSVHLDFHLSVVAVRSIEPEEEICIDYVGVDAATQSTATRRRLVRDKYGFECMCAKCTSGA